MINPASHIPEPHIAGTKVPTSTIAKCVWDGYSLYDICALYPELNALAVFNACWYETRYGDEIWYVRWRRWVAYAEPYLKEEDIEDLVLPPQKLEFLHTPLSLYHQYSVKMKNGWLGLIS